MSTIGEERKEGERRSKETGFRTRQGKLEHVPPTPKADERGVVAFRSDLRRYPSREKRDPGRRWALSRMKRPTTKARAAERLQTPL